jgi:hypothetical protein
MSFQFGSGSDRPAVGFSAAVDLRPVMRQVYLWMTLGLLATTAIAIAINSNESLMRLAFNPPILFGAIIAELILVLVLSMAIRRLSPGLAIGLFFVYAILNGFTLSFIFLAYELGTITMAFLCTAAAFGAMTVLGFTTTLDLSQYRTYFFMGLIGLLVALVINVFLRSTTFDLLISMFGVLLFTALTAYDTQKIKRMAEDPQVQSDGGIAARVGVLGALTLYLDFVNLFLFLLRLFGRRR